MLSDAFSITYQSTSGFESKTQKIVATDFNGEYFAVGYETGKILVIHVGYKGEGTHERFQLSHPEGLSCLKWSDRMVNYLVASGPTGHVNVWSLPDMRCVCRAYVGDIFYPARIKWVSSCITKSDTRLAIISGAADGRIFIWEVKEDLVIGLDSPSGLPSFTLKDTVSTNHPIQPEVVLPCGEPSPNCSLVQALVVPHSECVMAAMAFDRSPRSAQYTNQPGHIYSGICCYDINTGLSKVTLAVSETISTFEPTCFSLHSPKAPVSAVKYEFLVAAADENNVIYVWYINSGLIITPYIRTQCVIAPTIVISSIHQTISLISIDNFRIVALSPQRELFVFDSVSGLFLSSLRSPVTSKLKEKRSFSRSPKLNPSAAGYLAVTDKKIVIGTSSIEAWVFSPIDIPVRAEHLFPQPPRSYPTLSPRGSNPSLQASRIAKKSSEFSSRHKKNKLLLSEAMYSASANANSPLGAIGCESCSESYSNKRADRIPPMDIVDYAHSRTSYSNISPFSRLPPPQISSSVIGSVSSSETEQILNALIEDVINPISQDVDHSAIDLLISIQDSLRKGSPQSSTSLQVTVHPAAGVSTPQNLISIKQTLSLEDRLGSLRSSASPSWASVAAKGCDART